MRPRRGIASAAVLAAIVTASSGSAWSADPPPPLTTSDFKIDLFQGPVIGSTRVIGLGGSYASVAEGAVGIPFNPATVAHRPYHSLDWFDWDIAFDFLLPGLFQAEDFDFDNNGSSTSPDYIVWNLGGMLQFGALGVGLYYRGQTFQVTAQEEQAGQTVERSFSVGLWHIQASVGYGLVDHQLILGGGVKAGMFDVREPGKGELFRTLAAGGEVGALFRPRRWPFRLAAALSIPVTSNTERLCETSQQCPSKMVMPEGVGLPWEVRVGASYRLGGDRPFNPTPPMRRKKKQKDTPKPTSAPASPPEAKEPDPDRDYLGGFYVLLTAELVIDGDVENGIGADGYFQQVRERAGESISLSPRLGVESEVWRRRLRLRAGGYWEPSRFVGHSGRMHGTFGFDLRLFDLNLWGSWSIRFASAVDLAVRYSNLSLSLGFWH